MCGQSRVLPDQRAGLLAVELLARTFRQDLKFTEVIERKDLNR